MNEEKQLESAGAIVLAGEGPEQVVALIHRRSPAEWRLPKGKLEPGETAAQAAEREVQEETGLPVTVGEVVGQTEYSYRQPQNRPIRKVVTFYLARIPAPLPLSVELRSFDQARWMPIPEALASLTWANERDLVEKAVKT
jgi:8-oxo-dGTP diphosphatase